MPSYLPEAVALSVHVAHLYHDSLRQNGLPTLAAATVKARPAAIIPISLNGIPSQVGEMFVGTVAIPMTSLLTRGARPDEGKQSKVMRVDATGASINRQFNALVPFARAAIEQVWRLQKTSWAAIISAFSKVGPHPPAITNLVSGKPRHRAPFFIRAAGGNRVIIGEHDRPPFDCATLRAVDTSAGAFACPDYSTAVQGAA